MDFQPFSLKYQYPNTGNYQIDQEITYEMKKEIASFYHEISDSLVKGVEYSLEITYDQKKCKNYITYILYTTFYTGGAHPNTKIETFTYFGDLKLTIQDLFTLEQLKFLSQFIARELMGKKGSIPDMVEIGTKADYSNFENFYYTEEGIVFLFSPYQVAPYSSGIIDVLVPNSVIQFIWSFL